MDVTERISDGSSDDVSLYFSVTAVLYFERPTTQKDEQWSTSHSIIYWQPSILLLTIPD